MGGWVTERMYLTTLLSLYIFIHHSYLILILQSIDTSNKNVINTLTKSNVTINLHFLLLQQKMSEWILYAGTEVPF